MNTLVRHRRKKNVTRSVAIGFRKSATYQNPVMGLMSAVCVQLILALVSVFINCVQLRFRKFVAFAEGCRQFGFFIFFCNS